MTVTGKIESVTSKGRSISSAAEFLMKLKSQRNLSCWSMGYKRSHMPVQTTIPRKLSVVIKVESFPQEK